MKKEKTVPSILPIFVNYCLDEKKKGGREKELCVCVCVEDNIPTDGHMVDWLSPD